MTGRLNPVLAMVAAALLAAPSLFPSSSLEAQNQQQTIRVVIPDFFATDGNDRNFGRDVGNELRNLIAALPGYVTVDRRDIENELREIPRPDNPNQGMRFQDLDCVYTRQLTSLIGGSATALLAFCMSYESDGDERRLSGIEVHDVWDQEEFHIEGFSIDRRDRRGAAQRIFDSFKDFVDQNARTVYCADYFDSGEFDRALENCNEALALNPNAMKTVFLRGEIFRQLERYEEALGDLERVVEADPLNEEALMSAGWLATHLGQTEKGRRYYSEYLELNPGNVAVRTNIAYEIADAGDPEGAMSFLEVGLAVEPDNVEMLDYYGRYAFAAASRIRTEVGGSSGGASQAVDPRAAEFYRKAIDALGKVFEAQGAEADMAIPRNIVNAYRLIGDDAQAIAAAERFLAVHARDVSLLDAYARSLMQIERRADAIAALRRIEAVNPDHPQLHLRLGQLLIQTNELDDAVAVLKQAVAKGADPNMAAELTFSPAAPALRAETSDWPLAIRMLEAAKEFEISSELRQKYDFYHGYAVFNLTASQQGGAVPAPQVARAALPRFQNARTMLSSAQAWARDNGQGQILADLLEQLDTYIEIQEGVIRRAGGSR